MLAFVRILGGGLALSLMLGELWRSWGVGRPFVFVVDDFVFGVPLLVGAILASRLTAWRRAFLAAGWAGNVGMLYGSFFTKLVEPDEIVAGNWRADTLTILIGAAFVTSIVGLLLTLMLRLD